MKANGQDAVNSVPARTEVKQETLKQFLARNKSSFEAALPKNTINVDRFVVAASMEITNNPKLLACDRGSIVMALGQAARYGLEVGSLMGQAWLIPYNESKLIDGKWQKQMTCHFQIGYKGLIMLARRSQTIKTISAECVYENDYFEVELGMNRHLTHKLDIRKPRGETIGYYCLVELTNGGAQFGVMSKAEAEEHRDKYSKSYQNKEESEKTVWDTNFDEMALKTVVIKTLKLCPISVEALEAVARAEREDLKDVSNLEYTVDIPDQLPEMVKAEEPGTKAAAPHVQASTAPAPNITTPAAARDDMATAFDQDTPVPSDAPEELDIF